MEKHNKNPLKELDKIVLVLKQVEKILEDIFVAEMSPIKPTLKSIKQAIKSSNIVRNELKKLEHRQDEEKENSEIIYSMIDAIKRVEELQLTAIFKNFHLKKIILPLEIYEELKKQCQTIVKDSIVNDYDYLMGIPVECNENISHIQYVVEGDFAYV